MVAPTGARLGKADHPALPLSLDEIAATARACQDAGAHGFHLHIRDADGAHSLDPVHYAEAMAAVTARAPALNLQITTEAAGRFDVATQLHCLATLRPAWASVSVREMARDPARAARFYATAAEAGTRLQHILFDTTDAAHLAHWQQTGVVHPTQTEVIFVLGRYADGPPSDPAQIGPFLASVPDSTPWMICAFGPTEHACLHHAARLGGDLRVGFENSLTGHDGTPWPDNAASVAALIRALPSTPSPTES